MRRGDIENLGLYVPFVFGMILRQLQRYNSKIINRFKKWMKIRKQKSGSEDDDDEEDDADSWMMTKNKKNQEEKDSRKFKNSCWALAWFVVTGAFIWACWRWEIGETRMLYNFIFSSVISPSIVQFFDTKRMGIPTGAWIVHGIVAAGLVLAWYFEGISHVFLGFLFLQAVPQVSSYIVVKSEFVNYMFLLAVLVFSLPYVSIAVIHIFFPSWEQSIPQWFIHILALMAHSPDRVQVDHYGALELESGASESAVRAQYRRLALKYHPDKVGTSPETVAKFQAIAAAAEALAKPKFKMEYDLTMQNQEFYMLLPRCYAWMTMMMFWAVQFMVDMYEMEGRRTNAKQQLYGGAIKGNIGLNPHLLGCSKERLKKWVEKPASSSADMSEEERQNARIEEMPALLMGDYNDLLTLRKCLENDDAKLLPLPVKGSVLKVSVYSDRYKDVAKTKSYIPGHLKGNTDKIRMDTWEQEIPPPWLRDIVAIEGKEYSADAVYASAPGKGSGAVFSVKFFKEKKDNATRSCIEIVIKVPGVGYQEKDELVLTCSEGPSLHLIVDTVSCATMCVLLAVLSKPSCFSG